jgi:hypothetical protein
MLTSGGPFTLGLVVVRVTVVVSGATGRTAVVQTLLPSALSIRLELPVDMTAVTWRAQASVG